MHLSVTAWLQTAVMIIEKNKYILKTNKKPNQKETRETKDIHSLKKPHICLELTLSAPLCNL